MIRAMPVALLAAVSCGRAKGVPDEDLGDLVLEPPRPGPIVVATAAKDPAELGRALSRPYRDLVAGLGPHTVAISSSTTIEEAGQVATELRETTKIELGEAAAFHAIYDNLADYGREVTFAGGTLYLRPRYQRWHARAPEDADEVATLRDSFFEPVAATWELLAPGVELTDRGAAEHAGRPVQRIELKRKPGTLAVPAETVVQRKWREARAIDAVQGEVLLDTATGAPLSVKLTGAVGFTRDGRRFTMKTALTAELSAIGTASTITAPPAEDIVHTPERSREVDERDLLLHGIAPPIRKNPDGTAATPTLPRRDSPPPPPAPAPPAPPDPPAADGTTP